MNILVGRKGIHALDWKGERARYWIDDLLFEFGQAAEIFLVGNQFFTECGWSTIGVDGFTFEPWESEG